jgi:hypothetical protein
VWSIGALAHGCELSVTRSLWWLRQTTELVDNKSGGQKEWRKAVWSPVLYHDESNHELYLFYSQSTKCLQWTAKKGNRLRLARWGPGGDIKYIKTRDLHTWSDPVTIYAQSSDGLPKVGPVCVSCV